MWIFIIKSILNTLRYYCFMWEIAANCIYTCRCFINEARSRMRSKGKVVLCIVCVICLQSRAEPLETRQHLGNRVFQVIVVTKQCKLCGQLFSFSQQCVGLKYTIVDLKWIAEVCLSFNLIKLKSIRGDIKCVKATKHDVITDKIVKSVESVTNIYL